MTVLIVIALLCIVALVLRAVLRDSGEIAPTYTPTTYAPTQTPTPPSLRSRQTSPARTTPRFSGRRVEAEPIATRPVVRATRSRMLNGQKVPAVKNGRAVIPADAIGLGCLRPIAECSLGDRCVCLNQNELRLGSRL